MFLRYEARCCLTPILPRARFVGCTGKRVVVEIPVRIGKLSKGRKVRVCVTGYVYPCRERYLVCPQVDRACSFKTLRCSVKRTAPPDIFPVVAPVAPPFERLLPLLVLSFSDRVEPLPRCHTALKLESHVLGGSDWFVLIELSPYIR